MLLSLLPHLRCPVTLQTLSLIETWKAEQKEFKTGSKTVVTEGLLATTAGTFYPIVKGVPRLLPESLLDFEEFLGARLPDYETKRQRVLGLYGEVIIANAHKNKRTKRSFTIEWGLYQYGEDKTWHLNKEEMMGVFAQEADLDLNDLQGKLVLDAGCGNGYLTICLSERGATAIGMDLSHSTERAYGYNRNENCHFIQGDVQCPPLSREAFDHVHTSGVLICTNNTELSFSCLHELLKPGGGRYSVWYYHARKGFGPAVFLALRRVTRHLPLRLSFALYFVFLLPPALLYRRLKGKPVPWRDQMIDLLDGLTPEYRWEIPHGEALHWYTKRGYTQAKVTIANYWGYAATGTKS